MRVQGRTLQSAIVFQCYGDGLVQAKRLCGTHHTRVSKSADSNEELGGAPMKHLEPLSFWRLSIGRQNKNVPIRLFSGVVYRRLRADSFVKARTAEVDAVIVAVLSRGPCCGDANEIDRRDGLGGVNLGFGYPSGSAITHARYRKMGTGATARK
jgi:hypothetical protein